MPQGLLLLPLLGGFAFLHLAHLFRFNAQRYDGNRLLFTSAVAGAILLLLARLLVVVGSSVPYFGPWAGQVWYGFAPFPYSDTCVLSLLLGPAMAAAVNRRYDPQRAKNKQLEENKRADSFTRLLHVASRDNRMISVTLASRKWYVGFVAEAPNLNPEEKFFRLLPIVSGYRDSNTLETFRTVFYEEALSRSESANFVITLPIAEVRSANFFDPYMYEEYFAQPEQS